MQREDLQKTVESIAFESLIGQIENEWFDCKGQPYKIETELGKRELAKDVSSFANGDGGFILIGLRTKQSAIHFGDEVEEIRPFAQSLVNTKQYRDVIRSWVYPVIEDLKVEWLATQAGKDKGIVVITIPPQRDAQKPFLVTTTLDGSGRKVEIVFGYVQRKGDSSQPLNVEDLQRALRSGLHYEGQLNERLDGIEMLLKSTVYKDQVEAQKKIDTARIEQRIESALEHDGMKNNRVMVISAYLHEPSQLKTIFLSAEKSIRRRLEQPPILRAHGWGLNTHDQAKIFRGEMIRVTNGDRKVIDLYRDGTLVFVGLADHNFLAWPDEKKQKLNPLAIVEVIYGYFSFYKLVLEDLEKRPDNITMRVDFRNLHKGGLKSGLVPYALNTYGQLFDDEKKLAPENYVTLLRSFATKDFDPGAMGYEIVKEIYLWFGIEEDKIPYVKNENGLRIIDVDGIKGNA